MTIAERPAALRGIRRATVIVMIVALGVAAILGIVLLLSGDWSDLQVRVLTTAFAVGAFATTALCHLAQVGRPLRLVGFVGIAASILALVAAIALVWSDLAWSAGGGWLWRSFGVLLVAAVSLAQANLLLLLAARRRLPVRIVLAIVLGLIAVVAVLVWLPIITDGDIPGPDGEWYTRLLGALVILDALGTIVLPVLGAVLRDDADGRVVVTIRLAAADVARLDAAAAAGGTTRAAEAAAALARGLDAAP